jgi:ADP-ribosylation factor GTPase-activating protein 1
MSQMKKADLAIVKSLPGNDRCAECPMKHPQWASVSFGTMFCLECSGIHRSLGVHISFVRSIAMDSWTESQLNIMKNGGNDKCNAYLKSKGISPVSYSTKDAVNGGIRKKYDNDIALLYKLQLKAGAEGKPIPTEVPQKKTKSVANGGGAIGGAGSGAAAASGPVDPSGMERLPGETDNQYIARQTRLREEAKARMAAKFGNNGGGLGGKRVMGGVGSSPHPSQQSGGFGGFNLDSLTTGLAGVTSTAATGFGSAWSLAKDTAGSVKSSKATSNVAGGVSDLGSSLWNSISQVSNEVAKEINAVVNTDDNENTFSELSQKMKAQRDTAKSSGGYAGFGSQDLMAKSSNISTARTASVTSKIENPSGGDTNGIAALPNETDQQYMQRQLRIQQEAKARMAAKFGTNPRQAMNTMSVGTSKPKPAAKPAGDDFFASFGT